MIVQEANFRDLPEFVSRCLNEFKVDKVRLGAILKFGMRDDEYWFKDVFNPLNPCYKKAVEILHDPILNDSRAWYWEIRQYHILAETVLYAI